MAFEQKVLEERKKNYCRFRRKIPWGKKTRKSLSTRRRGENMGSCSRRLDPEQKEERESRQRKIFSRGDGGREKE